MVGAIHKNLSPRNFSTYHKESMEEYGRDCCVRGYHVYQEIWEAAVGEVLVCEREPRNVEGSVRCGGKERQNSYRTPTEKNITHLFTYLPISARTVGLYCL